MAKEQRPLPLQRRMSSRKGDGAPGRHAACAAALLPTGCAAGSPVSRRRHQATPLTNRWRVDRSLCV